MPGALLFLILSSGYGLPQLDWQATMCFTGRYQWYRQPRHYFSPCLRKEARTEWCEPYNTKHAVVTPGLPTKAQCLNVVRQNYPNLRRFENRLRKPVICDFNIEGPQPRECSRH
jgi:hypothetical protein